MHESNDRQTYLVRMTTAGVATAEALRLAGFSLTMGPDKAVWMVGATLIRITTSGAETSFKLPSTYFDGRTIAAGPDGTIWLSGLSESTSQQHVLVRVLRVLTVTPATLTFTAAGQMRPLSVTEKAYSGSWTAVSSNAGRCNGGTRCARQVRGDERGRRQLHRYRVGQERRELVSRRGNGAVNVAAGP